MPVVAILFAVVVWGAQFVLVRLGIVTDLTGYDLATLRFAVAGPLLLPVFLRFGWRNCAGLGWRNGLLLAITGGLPLAAFSNTGMSFAPANHAACLQPGTVAVLSTIAGAIMAGTGLPPAKAIGLLAAAGGLFAVAFGASGYVSGPQAWIGDLIFVTSGTCWTFYTFWMTSRRLSPIAATVAVGVFSLPMVPLLLMFFPSKLATAPWPTIIFHGLFQGLLNYVIAFGLWSYAARSLGPVRIGMYSPLIPVIGVLFAIPVLGEFPTAVQWGGVVAVIAGLLAINSADLLRATRRH